MEPEHGAPTVLGAAVANYGGGSGGGARQGCLRGGQAPRSLQEEDRGHGLERAAPRVWTSFPKVAEDPASATAGPPFSGHTRSWASEPAVP